MAKSTSGSKKLQKVEAPVRERKAAINWGKQKKGFEVTGTVKTFKEFTNSFGNITRVIEIDSDGEHVGAFVPAKLRELIDEIPKKKLIGSEISITYNGKVDNVHQFEVLSSAV